MKSYEYNAVTWDGDFYCIQCLPKGVRMGSEEVHPVYADCEWGYAPSCCICGYVHDYVNIINEGE